jgi:glyoxylase-like metal-dependent hydrolase (beta-lactamase superfamily II)
MTVRRIGLLFALGLLGSTTACQARNFPFQVHTFALPGAAYARAFLVETERTLVAVDAGFMPQHAALLIQRAEALGKPISHVVLTHAHVDHYGGLSQLVAAGARPVATAGVRDHLVEQHETNYARFGMSAPPAPGFPDAPEVNLEFTLDAVRFSAIPMGAGESYADVVWKISAANSQDHYFAGDLVMFGIPPFLQSGHSANWLASLESLAEMIAGSDNPVLHEGHNAAPEVKQAPLKVIAWQQKQLRALTGLTMETTKGTRLLTGQEIGALTEHYLTGTPEIDTNYAFILTTSLNVPPEMYTGLSSFSRFGRVKRLAFSLPLSSIDASADIVICIQID